MSVFRRLHFSWTILDQGGVHLFLKLRTFKLNLTWSNLLSVVSILSDRMEPILVSEQILLSLAQFITSLKVRLCVETPAALLSKENIVILGLIFYCVPIFRRSIFLKISLCVLFMKSYINFFIMFLNHSPILAFSSKVICRLF